MAAIPIPCAAAAVLRQGIVPLLLAGEELQPQAPQVSAETISAEDDVFLEELEKANFQFFRDQTDSETGLVKDRCNVRATDQTTVASIAATGFGLTAVCIGHKRGYLSLGDAHQRVITALHFLYEKMPTHRGFFYHFANLKTGERIWESEISSIDTAILLCGVMTCRQYFRHSEITRLAHDIFARRRVDMVVRRYPAAAARMVP